MVHDPSINTFFATDLDGNLLEITTTGTKTILGNIGLKIRGMALGADIRFPGTPDDLYTTYSINGGGSVPVIAGTDVVALDTGDSMAISHDSLGALHFAGEVIVFGSLVPDFSVMSEPFTGLHVGGSVFAIIAGFVGDAQGQLAPGGVNYGFVAPIGLVGNAIVIQSTVLAGTLAVNNIFASTDGIGICFN